MFKLLSSITASVIVLLLLPLFVILYLLVKTLSTGPFFFRQKRMGKNKKVFTILKIRTMHKYAERYKERYKELNEADGPVFKIKDDPRYTKIGKVISQLGLDELPQLINVIKGEMAFVGPRPLPVTEAKQIPKKYEKRFSVLPGITSLWVVEGGHTLSFHKWMELDIYYVTHKSFWLDCSIIGRTMILFLRVVSKRFFR